MDGRFGRYLIERGFVREPQLAEALRCQSVYGGRLGTNLIELGYLGLVDLSSCLQEYLRVPAPPIEWLEHPDPKALKVIPIALCRRYKILPLKLETSEIHVAMVDPVDETQLDHIATAASRIVVPYVMPEARLFYWLEIHLEIDRHPRFVNLATQQRQTGLYDVDLGGDEQPAPGITGERRFELPTGEAPRADATDLMPDSVAAEIEAWSLSDGPTDEDGDELLLEELVEVAPESESAPIAAATPLALHTLESTSSGRVAALEAQLQGTTERDDIITLALRIAALYSETSVLFRVTGGTVVGFRALDSEVEQRIQAVELPVDTQSVFAQPAVTGTAYRGCMPEGGIDARLLEALGRSDIQELVVLPIAIRGRVVNLLYCDNGGDAFGETSVAALRALCDCVAAAYERLILDRKRDAAEARVAETNSSPDTAEPLARKRRYRQNPWM